MWLTQCLKEYACDLDEQGVYFPQSVFIKNYRLCILQLALRVATFTYCVSVLARGRIWLKTTVPVVSPSFWFETITPAYREELLQDLRHSDFCDELQNSRYNYEYGRGWVYRNFTCRPLEPTAFAFKSSNSLFVATHVEETFEKKTSPDVDHTDSVRSDLQMCEKACAMLPSTSLGGSTIASYKSETEPLGEQTCSCKASSKNNYFVPGVAKVAIGVEHSAVVSKQLVLAGSGPEETYVQKLQSDDVLTVLWKKDGDVLREMRRVEPGGAIILTIEEILELSGVTLDSKLDITNRNEIKDDVADAFPALRLTGLELELQFAYYNKDNDDHKIPEHSGCVCHISVRAVPRWTSQLRVSFDKVTDRSGEGSYRKNYMYGIRINVDSTGGFSSWHLTGLFSWIADTIVFMSLPTFVLMVFAKYFLGPISEIYKQFIVRQFTFRSMCNQVLCQALIASHTYNDLLRWQCERLNVEYDYVSSITIAHKIFSVFEDEEQLHDDDISGMLGFLLKELCVSGDDLNRSATKRCVTACDTRIDSNTAIDRRHWIELISSNDLCSPRMISETFRHSREPSILERIFDPHFDLRKNVRHELHNDVNMSKGFSNQLSGSERSDIVAGTRESKVEGGATAAGFRVKVSAAVESLSRMHTPPDGQGCNKSSSTEHVDTKAELPVARVESTVANTERLKEFKMLSTMNDVQQSSSKHVYLETLRLAQEEMRCVSLSLSKFVANVQDALGKDKKYEFGAGQLQADIEHFCSRMSDVDQHMEDVSNTLCEAHEPQLSKFRL